LGFVASLYAALSPAWKADRTATTAQTDYQLWHYCAIDVAQTYRVLDPLSRHVGIMRQETAFKADTKMQAVCVDMHRNGLRVDQRRRAQWEYHYSAIAYEWRARCEEIAADLGFKNHNPGSVHQVRDLIYDKCGVSIPDGANGKPKITRGGDPSTDDEAMRAIWVADTTPRDAKIYINALRRYRAAQKVLGTYLFRLRPQAMIADGLAEGIALIDLEDAANDDGTLQEGVDPYELAADRQRRRRIDRDRRRGVVWPDGRVRSSFNAHVTTVGRIASSGPNLLNVPSVLKDIFVPEDGRIFVGADADQIHLRIAAARWRISRYIEAFRLGADPHAMTAFLIFGDAFRTATGFPKGEWVGDYFILAPGAKWKGQAKVYRDLSKRVQYASLYKATPETVWRVVKESEEADGRLTYAALALDEVRRMHADWLGGAPEVKDGWAYELELYQQKGYGEDPTVGRRRLFLDGKNENEVINFPILAAEAGLMGAATVGIAEDLRAGYAGPGTGVVHQNYDSICLEVPIRDLARARRLLHERMNYDHPALPGVRFSGEVGAGLNLKAA
jgi:DNA polymerase I-like protein with 3'-5' exonuclease and polymerase domains